MTTRIIGQTPRGTILRAIPLKGESELEFRIRIERKRRALETVRTLANSLR